ncbi:MAG: glycosyl transferase, partial [Caulobacteraceae bacterium]|nr:glycosyl transferase [Caulobacter sp.]
MTAAAPILVDHTHCGRHVTGLERITLELFSAEALAPLAVTPVRAPGRKAMMLEQMVGLPWRAVARRRALVLCPGFPPSIPLTLLGRDRVIPYIHDLFLLTRPDDLNRRAKLYMVAPFRMVVRRAPLFLVNSETTAAELRRFCRPEARIQPYRPAVRNVFAVAPGGRAARADRPGALRLLALGTVEPRKNLMAAAAVVAALRATTHPEATLDIVGRPGWGVDEAALAARPGVTLHGYQPAETVRALIDAADALIST